MTQSEPTAPDIAKLPVAATPAKKATLPETTEGYPWVSNQEVKKESNPFTDKDWRMLVYAWFGLLVRIILVFGAIFTVYQFLSAREEKRVERSLALVDVWEQPDYQKAQRALKQRLADLNAKYASLLGDNPSPTDRAVYLERIGMEALTAESGAMPLPEFEEHFEKIVYFLNRTSFCVEGDLCSAEVVDAYFRDFAVSFWSYFSAYVARQRKIGSPNYAQPLENYVLGGKPVATP